MATRPYWKGYLKLSLVTCPVALYPASSQSEKLHFHQINRKTGNRLRHEYEAALKKLVKRKAAGKTIEATEPIEDRSNVIDLMDALKQSMKGRAKSASRKQPRAKTHRKTRRAS